MALLGLPKRYADLVARLRVPGGFLMIAAFAILADPSPASIALGGSIAAPGMLLRAWAAGHLAKNRDLATSGPYAYMRNPLYAGTLTAALGLAVAARSMVVAAIAAGVFLLVYLPVIELEQQHLRTLFPGYAQYAREVPLIRPTFSYRGAARAFSWRLFLRNQEYQAAIAFALAMLYLLWRAS
jgi:protein-S-isoprenylcysteine O-methyltransferase Ste14